MITRSLMLCCFAGLALATAGCGRHGLQGAPDAGPGGQPASTGAPDADPAGQSAGAGDARLDARDGSPTRDSARPGPDGGGPDVDNDWTLPHTGGPVWRDSTIPYCNSGGVFFSDLWSDGRGVYAISELWARSPSGDVDLPAGRTGHRDGGAADSQWLPDVA